MNGVINMSNTKVENLKGLNADNIAGQFIAFVQQKPCFDRMDYGSNSSYQQDYRYYKKYADLNRKIPAWELVNLFSELTDEEIAKRVFSGRLIINEKGNMEYIVGQYFPTEYQQQAYQAYERARQLVIAKNV